MATKIKIGRPEPESMGLCVVVRFVSQTRAGMYHYTFYSKREETVFCSCEGFQAHTTCWHVTKMTEKLLGGKK